MDEVSLAYVMIVFLYFRNLVKQYHRKKGAKSRLQETYQSIKIEGVEVISGVYSRAEDDQVIAIRLFLFIVIRYMNINYYHSHFLEFQPQNIPYD